MESASMLNPSCCGLRAHGLFFQPPKDKCRNFVQLPRKLRPHFLSNLVYFCLNKAGFANTTTFVWRGWFGAQAASCLLRQRCNAGLSASAPGGAAQFARADAKEAILSNVDFTDANCFGT
jgi:hypothetical protein